jgi:methylmalonyl-CoA mutase cobalamin-binding subunit
VEEVVNTAIQENAQAIAMTSYQGGHNEYFKCISNTCMTSCTKKEQGT